MCAGPGEHLGRRAGMRPCQGADGAKRNPQDEAQPLATSRRASKAPRRDSGASDEIVEIEQPAASKGAKKVKAKAPSNQNRWSKGEEDHDPDVEQITKSYEEAARSLSEASAVAKELSAEEMNSLVSAVMRHMLFKPTDAGPTARTELATLINSKYKGKRNLTNVVIALAQMRELEKRRKVDPKKKLAAGTPDVKAEKTFVLRSLLPAEMRRMHVDSPAQRARHAFTMTVLALLVSNSASDQIFEAHLWEHLNALGMVKGKTHPTFGDPDAQLQLLVKTRYLTKDKVRDNDGAEQVQYEIAENAYDEIGRENILSFIAGTMHAPSLPAARPAEAVDLSE